MENTLLEFLVCVRVETPETSHTKTMLIYADSPDMAARAARMVGEAGDKPVTVIGVTEVEKDEAPLIRTIEGFTRPGSHA